MEKGNIPAFKTPVFKLGEHTLPTYEMQRLVTEMHELDFMSINHFKSSLILLLAGHNTVTADDENFRFALHSVVKILDTIYAVLRQSEKLEFPNQPTDAELNHYKERCALLEELVGQYKDLVKK